MDTRAPDLAPRMAAIAREAASSARSPSPADPRGVSASAGSGQVARCTEPSAHHDHTSSVTNGRNGANSRSTTDRASLSAARAEPAGPSPRSP